MEILKKRFKNHSHQTIEDIKRMQHIYRKDILQPRLPDGNLNPDFVRHWGVKGLRIDNKDVKYIARKDRSLLKKLDEHRYAQINK